MNNWKEILEQEFNQEYFKKISEQIKNEYKNHTVFPKKSDIFNAFEYCELDNTKVIILGMDPYPNPNQAHGLSFSVKPDIKPPPSLKNIFKEIKNDLGIEPPAHGYLKNWAKQGVLLLNAALTVRLQQPGSHMQIWEPFTTNIIRVLNAHNTPKVFMLWGAFAKRKKYLITQPQHLILEAAHPSPLSAFNGFFGCKHFSKTNEFLIKNNITPINWQI